jgi:aldehyde:ferredoxin oxidoreductase
MNFAGNGMPGYHTGYGTLLGTTVGARHSHLCNAGYSIDQSLEKLDKDKIVDGIFNEEKERCMLNSLTICLFARKVYDRKTILSALNAIGYEFTDEDLTAIADRNYRTKLRIKDMLGFDLMKVRLPKRFFETPSLWGRLDEGIAYELIEMYDKKIKEFVDK